MPAATTAALLAHTRQRGGKYVQCQRMVVPRKHALVSGVKQRPQREQDRTAGGVA